MIILNFVKNSVIILNFDKKHQTNAMIGINENFVLQNIRLSRKNVVIKLKKRDQTENSVFLDRDQTKSSLIFRVLTFQT